MERRVLVAIFLSFLVLYAYQALVVKPVQKPATPAAAAPSAPAPSAAASSAATASSPAAAPSVPAPAATLTGDTEERDTRLETEDVVAVFTNRGARLKSWRLTHYKDSQGQPQELVVNRIPDQPLPFSIRTTDDTINAVANSALYRATSASAGTDLTYEYRDAAGVHIVKSFHLDRALYGATLKVDVSDGNRPLTPTILWGPALGDIGEITRGMQPAQGLLFENGRVQRLSASDIGKQPAREGEFRYAGVDDNYFMAVAFMPGAGRITYQPVSLAPPAGSKEAARALMSFAVEPQGADAPIKFFIGPKDFDLLTATDRDLAAAVNFGRFSFIVVPLLRSLKWINGYVGNWGWSIVILTLMINAIMAPLRHKQVVSMRKMQEIQPEVKAIQERYSKLKATDPAKQKMNQELMALYREKKANPAAGCVPMLLTLPIMLAMWALLQTSIELRGAPWVGWIHDLSAHDPYDVLPVLMVGTQFWQQLMMPAAGADPAQQKMMLFMPLVMGFIFLFLPAGALLYYVVGTGFGLGQQYLTNYLIGPPQIRNVRPPAERRLKRVGAGKTDAARER